MERWTRSVLLSCFFYWSTRFESKKYFGGWWTEGILIHYTALNTMIFNCYLHFRMYFDFGSVIMELMVSESMLQSGSLKILNLEMNHWVAKPQTKTIMDIYNIFTHLTWLTTSLTWLINSMMCLENLKQLIVKTGAKTIISYHNCFPNECFFT